MLSNEISQIPLTHWIAYVGIAISGMSGFFCMTKALKMVDPTLVAFLRSLEIVFGFIFQVAVMKQIPTVLSLIGIFCKQNNMLGNAPPIGQFMH